MIASTPAATHKERVQSIGFHEGVDREDLPAAGKAG